jgi:hypothetical protein
MIAHRMSHCLAAEHVLSGTDALETLRRRWTLQILLGVSTLGGRGMPHLEMAVLAHIQARRELIRQNSGPLRSAMRLQDVLDLDLSGHSAVPADYRSDPQTEPHHHG